MKNLSVIALLIFTITACKQNEKPVEVVDYSKENLEITTSIYPENITKVFEAHGGLEQWNTMQSLAFTMEKPDGDELTITNLKSRESYIDMPKHTIGFDGEEVWILNKGTEDYKSNPKFYYNLMFYFYAMPFVLADDGIIYTDVEPLVFEGESYPGIKISYESGVGESPEDEYILYYNPNTFIMEWLGYTVTYFSKEKSKEFHFIKYSEWQTVENLKLPKVLTWYHYENNKPTKKRNDLLFKDIKISIEAHSINTFKKPESATVVE
ncbi:DUF6503 family protein [Lacinutrix salivirga]